MVDFDAFLFCGFFLSWFMTKSFLNLTQLVERKWLNSAKKHLSYSKIIDVFLMFPFIAFMACDVPFKYHLHVCV